MRGTTVAVLLALVLPAFYGCESGGHQVNESLAGGQSESTQRSQRVERDELVPASIQFPSIHGQEQQASHWCWAACTAAAINSLLPETAIDQPQVVREIFADNLPDRGARLDTIVSGIDGRRFVRPFRYGGKSIEYTLAAEFVQGMPHPHQLADLADGNHAVIVALPGHVAVLQYAGTSKYRTYLDRDKPLQYTTLEVWDPWPRRGWRSITAQTAFTPDSDDFIDGIVVISLSEREITTP